MKNFFVFIVLSVLLFSSCKKERDTEIEKISTSKKESRTDLFKIKIDEIIKSQNIQNKKIREIEFIKNEIKNLRKNIGRPTQCPQMLRVLSDFDITCDYPNSEVTFTWAVLESRAYAGQTLSYSFQIETSAGINPITPSLLSETDLGCDDTGDMCLTKKIYSATIILSSLEISGSYKSTVTALCSLPGSSTYQDVSPWISFGYTNDDYQNSPARIWTFGYTGNVFIGTECSLLCTGPYIKCPTSIYFRYKLGANGTWIYPSVSPYGTTLPISTPGLYNWEAINYYSFGQSQMNSGTFEVF